MNRTTTIIVIVVVLVVALGAWYWSATMPGAASPTASSTEQTTQGTNAGTGGTTTGSAGSQSLGQVLSQGGNFTCTVETITAGQHSTGTVYGSQGKTRLDFTVESNGTTVNTHIIRASGFAYTWVDGQTTGIKTAITTGGTAPQPGQGGYISVDDTTNVSSTCHPWSPDATQFVPPKGITFVVH